MPARDSAPAELLAALAGALSALGAGWYVFGAQAALIWGRPRLTADVDVTVRLDPEEPERLVRVLEASGFQLRVSAADDFVRRTRVLPFVYLPNGLPLDVVLAGAGLEELFLSRAVPDPVHAQAARGGAVAERFSSCVRARTGPRPAVNAAKRSQSWKPIPTAGAREATRQIDAA